MKKIILSVLSALMFLPAMAQDDKAFHKGSITVDPNIGFAIYGTKIHAEYDQDYWTTSGIQTKRVTEDTTDAAASAIYGLNAEYGLTDWFGLGIRFGFSNYFEETE